MIIMYPCPACHNKAKARTSRTLSAHIKEKYYRCHNPACLCTFKTYECFEHFITTTRDPTMKPDIPIQEPVKQPLTQPIRRYSMRLE